MAFGKKKTQTQNVVLPNVERRRLAMRITGTSPLIAHRFEEKAITQMLAKQRHFPMERMAKNPHEQFEAAKYKNLEGKDCIPAMSVKKAMVEATGSVDDLTKKASRGGFYILGEYLPIKFDHVEMRVDMVRMSGPGKTPDVRFRPEYHEWSVDFALDYNPRHISLDHLIYVLREAGTSVGILEWRPQKDGSHGTFDVEVLEDKHIAAIVKACSVPRQPLVLPTWVLREIEEGGGTVEEVVSETKKIATRPRAGKGLNGASVQKIES